MSQQYNPFTNSLYDKCNLNKKDQESTGPFNYITSNIYENNNSCFLSESPFMHNQFPSIPANIIDAESDLRNQTRLLSRCPETRFDPTKNLNCKDCKNCDSGIPCECGHCRDRTHENTINECNGSFRGLIPNYTRIEKPCNVFSGVTINRFESLCENHQDLNNIQSNNYIGTNTRLQVKDVYTTQKNQNSQQLFGNKVNYQFSVL